MNAAETLMLDRPLPHNLDAERDVLGVLFIAGERFKDVADRLHAVDFYLEANRLIFRTMARLAEDGEEISQVSVIDELRQAGKLERAEGVAYISSLGDGVPAKLNISRQVEIIERHSRERSAIQSVDAIKQLAHDGKLGEIQSHVATLVKLSQPVADGKPAGVQTEWPEPPAGEAFYGLAGDFVRTVSPHSEADAAALLVGLLVGFGNAAGHSAHFRVESDKHTANLFTVIVGPSGTGRKGTAKSRVQEFLLHADPQWAATCGQSGLSSGEGLIWAVRDAIERQDPVKQDGRVVGYERVIADHGIADKRALFYEPEFSSFLRVAARDGNILSPVTRQAWDSGDLRIRTKNSPATATGAHISILGNITRDELLRCLTTTDMGNGLANRFLWVCARRSKLLPDGGDIPNSEIAPVARRLNEAITFAKSAGEIRRDESAQKIWRVVYERLTAAKPGLLGAILSRSDAQVVRLSLIYALLDCSPIIRAEHLQAAIALWEFCEASARFIFGDAVGDPVADAILEALRSNPDGMTRAEISGIFSRNKNQNSLDLALRNLAQQGLARLSKAQQGEKGRPAEVWVDVRPGER